MNDLERRWRKPKEALNVHNGRAQISVLADGTSRKEQPGVSPMLLLDQICDPLEAIVNLAYLLEAEAEDGTIAQEYVRLLTSELGRVIAAAQALHTDCCASALA